MLKVAGLLAVLLVLGCGSTPPEGDCVPEPDSSLCGRLERNCGTLTALDNCGTSRTAGCGSCRTPQTCGGGGEPNVCGGSSCTPESDAALCTRVGRACGSITSTDNCGASRTVTCGTCGSGQGCSPQGTCGPASCTPGTCDSGFYCEAGRCQPEPNRNIVLLTQYPRGTRLRRHTGPYVYFEHATGLDWQPHVLHLPSRTERAWPSGVDVLNARMYQNLVLDRADPEYAMYDVETGQPIARLSKVPYCTRPGYSSASCVCIQWHLSSSAPIGDKVGFFLEVACSGTVERFLKFYVWHFRTGFMEEVLQFGESSHPSSRPIGGSISISFDGRFFVFRDLKVPGSDGASMLDTTTRTLLPLPAGTLPQTLNAGRILRRQPDAASTGDSLFLRELSTGVERNITPSTGPASFDAPQLYSDSLVYMRINQTSLGYEHGWYHLQPSTRVESIVALLYSTTSPEVSQQELSISEDFFFFIADQQVGYLPAP